MTDNQLPPDGQGPNEALVPRPAGPPARIGGGNYLSADSYRTLLEAAHTAPEHISSILWLVDYGRQHHLSQADLGGMIGVDKSTVSRLLRGNYAADIAPLVVKIEEYRRNVITGNVADDGGPVCETSMLTEIGLTCDVTRAAETVCVLTGRSHTGKTWALRAYAERNKDTVLVRTPRGGAAKMFMSALVKACGISERQSYEEIRDRLLGYFRPGMLLIVDEAHQMLIGRKLQTVTLETVRELHDLTGCGVVICGTPVFEEALQKAKTKVFFEQLDNRAAIVRKLPDTALWSDVEMVLAAHGLAVPAPTEKLHPEHHLSPEQIVRAIVASNGLGKLVGRLEIAKLPAAKRSEPFTWEHVVRTDAMLAGWRRGDQIKPRTEKGGR